MNDRSLESFKRQSNYYTYKSGNEYKEAKTIARILEIFKIHYISMYVYTYIYLFSLILVCVYMGKYAYSNFTSIQSSIEKYPLSIAKLIVTNPLFFIKHNYLFTLIIIPEIS